MSTSPSPKRQQSARHHETADPSSKMNRTQSARVQQTAPHTPFVSQARPKSLYRHNKLYRGPPTPPPEVQYDREKSFILDCKAVSNISNDYSTANPKLGSVIPPYNAQLDPHVEGYFDFFGVRDRLRQVLQKTYFLFIRKFFILFSPLLKNQLLVESMIDSIQMVMVTVIYHFEIDLVQVQKTTTNIKTIFI
jgi:hypothetical protein